MKAFNRRIQGRMAGKEGFAKEVMLGLRPER